MHNTIYKLTLNLVSQQILLIPEGAKILSAHVQRDQVCVYASVDSFGKTEKRTIALVQTDHALPKIATDQALEHIDTVQLHGLVWHVFEITKNN